ncbi:MgtC/SapB family protein [Corallococcus praedator]|uniref:MgtC/SapB family protein n=1 Tax=Corallococcus praedator TaxID=2316724 RepID=A0ABX9QEJ7_9BACT|nr:MULTISPECIES: MgtC/SapB family protein [Corallococcus]RKH13648.1 MgtC/SapB family protein [Corallococcus sp. CA047B]RKH26328.1 MgtC/SapB family protein [Corallococcus sp. CA031C]RKI01043.1 MgtC/SapB family protein [Corallococcus praedator]
MDPFVLIGRLVLATFLGGILGVEREARSQSAGLRTHTLVALGSCCFTLSSIYTEWMLQPGVSPGGSQADISRIASQIVVGIGFLGAGVILREGGAVKGLTTAANLWVTAAVGLACGLGMYLAAGVTVGLALLSLVVLRPVARALTPMTGRHGRHNDEDGDPANGEDPRPK